MSLFLTRQPIVNRLGKIVATRFCVHERSDNAAATVDALNDLTDSWPQGGHGLFFRFETPPGRAALLDWVAPANAVIELPGTPFSGEEGAGFVAALRESGLSLCYDFDTDSHEVFASGAHFRFIGFDVTSFSPAQLQALRAKTETIGIPLALNVDEQQEFRACLDAGMSAAAGWFIKRPAGAPAKQLNASQAHIVRVLNLVRGNADVGEIETALKQDVALSYKLLRYINSVGFGLSCEVQSFRHAVAILGYDKLNKWLSLLLVTANRDAQASTLMHTAVARGRLMEQLGEGLIDPSEHDNLFITGAFSLLDRLLGVEIDRALDTMALPPPITDALLGGNGLYAPFLDLARACEKGDGAMLAEKAGLLGLSSERLNRAHLAALTFADAMEY